MNKEHKNAVNYRKCSWENFTQRAVPWEARLSGATTWEMREKQLSGFLFMEGHCLLTGCTVKIFSLEANSILERKQPIFIVLMATSVPSINIVPRHSPGTCSCWNIRLLIISCTVSDNSVTWNTYTHTHHCTHTHTHVCTHTNTYVPVHTHTQTLTCVCVHTQTYICLYTHTHTHTKCTHTQTHACVHTNTYMPVHTHTHKHTHTQTHFTVITYQQVFYRT